MIKSKEKQKVKSNEEIGVKYGRHGKKKYYEREEGREEGSKFKLLEQIIKNSAKIKLPKPLLMNWRKTKIPSNTSVL